MKKKKKANPSGDKRPLKKRTLSSEIIGILIVFLSLFLLISLISFNSKDPSWASVTSSDAKVHNYGGKVGASFGEALLQFLGLSSFIFPFILGYLGIRAILGERTARLLLRIGSGVLLIFILSSLFFLLFQSFPWGGTEIPAGGIIGSSLSSLLIRYFSQTGTLIFLVAALILYIMFSTEFSLGKVLRSSGRFFDFAFKKVRIRVIDYQRSKNKEKEREKVNKKWATPPPEEEKNSGLKEKKSEKKEEKKEKEAKKGLKRGSLPSVPEPARPIEKTLFPEMENQGDYRFPPFNLLDPGKPSEKIDKAELYEKKQRIEEKLRQFKVQGEVREYHPGPVITTYEFYPDPGIKISQVAGLSEDLSLALKAESVRIQRIPGKSSLGVEIPNNKREIINLRDIIQSEKFMNSPSKLSFALGKTVHGEVYVTDLTVMPHLLIAGATGTGKSVALNALIASILYKASPEEVKLILIDPKRLEFTLYEGIPHLLSPVINDPKKAGPVLLYAIKKMEDRYQTMNLAKVRNIEQYNQQMKQLLAEKKGKLSEEEKLKLKPFPYIVIIIDELAELMMVGKQDVDECITRLAQLARAVGIHLVMATQRPSVDVITGTIKNNFSSRIAFRVPSKIDARIILDTQGAEKLLGLGDMLFMPPNYPRIIRLHCAYISIPEVRRLVKFVREQGPPKYDEKIVNVIKSPSDQTWEESGEKDELFDQAVRLILLTGQASVSYLQRKLKLGYARAARIIDQMELEGILGPGEGSKPREILVDPKAYLKQIEKY